jgi:hypothetical protein
MQGVQDGKDRMRGVRIYDVSNPRAPRLIKNVQTCRGSHTHTIVPHPTDRGVIYIYVGGSSVVRDAARCRSSRAPRGRWPRTRTRRTTASTSSRAAAESRAGGGLRLRAHLPGAAAPGGAGRRGAERHRHRPRRGGPSGCHDLTSYPAYHLVAGSCGSFGILLDVRNPEKPVVTDAKSDLNFSLWHTAVFSNDARRVVFTDEWGGGTAPRCRATDPFRLGGNTVLTIAGGR